METNKYDTHTIFIKCGAASPQQIIQVFSDSLDQYNMDANSQLDSRFYVNLIENADNISFGKGYVYVSNSQVYHMLLGKNPDGTERCEYIDDPDWVPPPRSRSNSEDLEPLKTKKESLNNSGSLFDKDWTYLMDVDEEYEKKLQEKKNKYICPKIKLKLDGLMTLRPVIIEGRQEYIFIEEAMKPDIHLTCFPFVLKSMYLPEHINIDHLKDKFRPYVSDSDSIVRRKYKGKQINDSYPFININSDRTAYIIFDEHTNDGSFAFCMTRKTRIGDTILFFSPAKRSDDIEESNRNHNYVDKHYNFVNNRKPNNSSPRPSPSQSPKREYKGNSTIQRSRK